MKFFISLLILVALAGNMQAQGSLFKAPEMEKVDHSQRQAFLDRFSDIKWTGRGMDQATTLDQVPTAELRARLQTVFGDPTQKLEDLINQDDFRPAKFIQFEYWFIVNGEIPLMLLDVDGPFTNGLVFGAASRYVDLMPEIKRELTKKLMETNTLSPFSDYYFDLEAETWHMVSYDGQKFSTDEIQQPKGFNVKLDR